MDSLCPTCGSSLASPDDICPRCALAQAIVPAVPTVPAELERRRPFERRMPAGPDRYVQWSLRTLLVIGIGLTLLLFAVVAVFVWVIFGV